MSSVGFNPELLMSTSNQASILAIGTSNPPNIFFQDTYPDFYFGVTNSNHLVDLKAKFKRICEKSGIRKRHMFVTEKFLKEHPNMCMNMAPSLDVRQEIVAKEMPKLGKEAASKAIEEWGQPLSSITHLVFCTTSTMNLPGTDYDVGKALGLDPSVNRLLLCQQGCFAGGTAIRVAKDIAENNKGARVLAISVESSSIIFRGPSKSYLDNLLGAAIFADGASAIVVGANPIQDIENPIFTIISAKQTTLLDNETTICGKLTGSGLIYNLDRHIPDVILKNIESVLVDSFGVAKPDWNEMFWVVHPGGPAILDKVVSGLGLREEKLRASRHVLREFGNMSSASVWFVLDEMRRRSMEELMESTGEGMKYGVLLGFGPGVTVETVVLRSAP